MNAARLTGRAFLAATVMLLVIFSRQASTQGAWTTKAPDPNAKANPAVAEINGKLYVHGFDRDPNGNQSSFVPRLSIYDPASNTWTIGASPSIIRAFANAVAIDEKMYVAGGCVMSDCRIGVTSALEIYTPATNTWSSGPAMATPRFGAAAGVIAGKLYVTGGSTACPPCNSTTTTEVYDPTTNTWTPGAPIPVSRELAAGAVVDGLLYVIGGYERGSVNAAVGTVSVYDPVANSWSTRSPMPIAGSGAAAGVILGDIYVVGGVNTSGSLSVPLSSNQSYNPASNTWTAHTPMSAARFYVSGAVVNQTLYVIDGFNGTQLASNEAYTPGDFTAPSTTATPSLLPNGFGWNRSDVTATLSAADNVGGSGVQSISYSHSGAQTGSGTVSGNSTAVVITNEGTTTLTYHATDVAGNVEADHSLTIQIDKTAPSLGVPQNQSANARSSAGAAVSFVLTSSDARSGLAPGSPAVSPTLSGATFPLGTTVETATAIDKAGNTTTAQFDVTIVASRPIIQVSGGDFTADGSPHPATATAQDFFGAPVAGSFTFSYAPGGSTAPAAAGRYSATATFISADPAFTDAAAWTTMAPNPYAKVASAVAAINGKLYVQGYDHDAAGNQGSFVPRLSIYDPAVNTWTTGASPGLIRAAASAVTINGKMYVVGGCVMSDCRIGTTTALEIYDPVTNAWSNGAPMVTARLGAAAGVIGGKLYVSGGNTACPPCVLTTTTEVYDPATNTWTAGAPIPVSRDQEMSAVVNGRLYVIGGSVAGVAVGRVDVYDPAANSWTSGAAMPSPRNGAAAAVINGQIYVVGGYGSSYLTANESYDPASDTWTEQAPMSVARTYLLGGVVNSKLYVIDGFNGARFSATEVFVPGMTSQITLSQADSIAPTTNADVQAPNANGWNRFDVNVNLNASDSGGAASPSGVQSVTYMLSGAQTGGGTVPAGNASFTISTEGTTTVAYHAADNAGNVEADHTFVVQLDKTAPSLGVPNSVYTYAATSAGTAISFVITSSDLLSGLDGPATSTPKSNGETFPLGTTVETVTAQDKAGNIATATFTVTIFATKPIIHVNDGNFVADGNPHPATATARDFFNAPVAGSFTFAYAPGGSSAPAAAGRYSATATFTSADPAFTDSAPWTTSPAAISDTARQGAVAGVLNTHELYVVGGHPFGDPTAAIPVLFRNAMFSQQTNSWTLKAPPLTGRNLAGGDVIGNKLYVVGGCIDSDCGAKTTGILEAYDPGTDSWTGLPSMPTARNSVGVGAINGLLYAAGGGVPFGPSDTLEVYDPNTNSWDTRASMPVALSSPAAAVFNNKLYVFDRGTTEVYDPATNTWTVKTGSPTSRLAAAAVSVANGRIYLLGGVLPGPITSPSNILAINEAYDPNADAWTTEAPLPTQRYALVAKFFDGQVYAIGGSTTPSVASGINEVFNYGLTAHITISPGDTTPPTTTANSSAPNANGWNRFNLNVSLNAFDPGGSAPSSGVRSITYLLTGAQTGGGTVMTGNTSVNITTEGTTTITYHATDNAGNVEPDHQLVIKLDKTAPTVANLPSVAVNATSSAGAVVTFNPAPSDAVSGVGTTTVAPFASGAVFPHGTTSENVTVTDLAGNSTSRSFTVTVNKTLLSIAVSPSTSTVEVGDDRLFQATGHFTSGPDQVLFTSGSGSGGSGGGGGGGGNLAVPAGGTWQLHFLSLNVSACGNVPGGFTSQPIWTDAAGAVRESESWGFPPLVQVSGTVTPQQVNLTLGCIPANGAVGSVSATWTGTRYEGTATLSNVSGPVVVRGWSAKAPVPTARFAFGAATVNGTVYAMGGGNPSLAQPIDAYTPATDTWSTVSQMRTSREGAGVAALNGKIYVAGGHISGGVESGVFEVYDPLANTWNNVPLPAMPTARAHLALVAAGGRLYAIGGDIGSSNSIKTAVVECYDPSTNQWTARAPMSAARNFLVAGAIDGETTIVTAGNSSGGPSTELYDVAANTWTPGPAMLSSTSGMAAAVVNNALFVFGGFGPNGSGLTLTHMFRPASGAQPAGWAALAAMPTARNELAAAAVGDVVYVIGGQAGSQVFSTVEAFSAPPPFDLMVSSGSSGGSSGGGSGGGSSSLPTVQWLSTSPSIASIDSSGFAGGNAPGETTIVATAAGVSCETSSTCATLTVTNPPHLTLTLAAGSASFGSVHVTVIDPSTGQTEGSFDLPIGEPQSLQTGSVMRLLFTAAAGYTVTPAHVDLEVHAGDDLVVPLLFALDAPDDTTPPELIVPGDQPPAEATGPAGASVTFPAATATDSGSGVASVSCDRVSGDSFSLGTARVTCSATDTSGNTASASFRVTVVDTTGPSVTMPANMAAEATGVGGAVVVFSASASDLVDGATAVSCAPAPGSTFVLGTTPVACTSADAHGNMGSGSFTVTVRDTVPPVVTLFAPSLDTFIPIAPATAPVEVEVIDAGGVLAVTINGVNATLNGTTPLGTRWLANLSTPPNSALTIHAAGSDRSANQGSLLAVFDNDGIAATLDKGRLTFDDRSSVYSSDFNDGTTAGTVLRSGSEWVSVVRRGAAVGVTLASSGSARIAACAGTIKSVVLNAPGESVDLSCGGDTVTVQAVSTPDVIEVYKLNTGARILSQMQCAFLPLAYRHQPMCQLQFSSFSYQYDYLISLGPGQTVSTGSPVTAGPDNIGPIHVTLLQVADDGSAFPVADFDLDPAESADVSVEPGINREDHLTFSVLHGTVTFDVGGVTQTVGQGQQAVVTPDLISPVITVPASITKDATSPGGVVVIFSASAFDNLDGPRPVTCAPASGSIFPVGTTLVSCTAGDRHGNQSTASFTVLVAPKNAKPPKVKAPKNMREEATGPSGASVTFAATATDPVDVTLPVTCIPASGSVFPLGATTVACSATNSAGKSDTDSFTITVRDTTAPAINSVTPSVTLLPDTDQAVPVSIAVDVTDAVDQAPACRITRVAGHGKDLDRDGVIDWTITGDLTLNIEANARRKKDRTYTITVKCTDAFANTSVERTAIVVSHQP